MTPATESDVAVKATATGTCHAIAFWFKLRLDGKVTLATGPKDSDSHWKQAVYSVSPAIRIKQGARVTVKARHNRNCIFLDLVR